MYQVIAQLASTLIGGVISGASNYQATKSKIDEDNRQAGILRKRAEEIQGMLDANKINETQALERLQQIFASTKSSVAEAIKGQADLAVGELAANYQSALKDIDQQLDDYKGQLSEEQEQRRTLVKEYIGDLQKQVKGAQSEITSALVQRGVVGGALTASLAKLGSQATAGKNKALFQQLQVDRAVADKLSQAENRFLDAKGDMINESTRKQMLVRQQAGVDQARQEAALGAQFAQQGEQVRQYYGNLANSLTGEKMGLETAAESMTREQLKDNGDPTMSFLNILTGGLAGGINKISKGDAGGWGDLALGFSGVGAPVLWGKEIATGFGGDWNNLANTTGGQAWMQGFGAGAAKGAGGLVSSGVEGIGGAMQQGYANRQQYLANAEMNQPPPTKPGVKPPVKTGTGANYGPVDSVSRELAGSESTGQTITNR